MSLVLAVYNRDGLVANIDQSLSSARVISSLKKVIEWRCKGCDNGPVFSLRNSRRMFVLRVSIEQKCMNG